MGLHELLLFFGWEGHSDNWSYIISKILIRFQFDSILSAIS